MSYGIHVTTDQAKGQPVLELLRSGYKRASREPDQNTESNLCHYDPK
jgi:hypothetical protein